MMFESLKFDCTLTFVLWFVNLFIALKESISYAITVFDLITAHTHIYPYKRTVKQIRSLQIRASVLFVYFFIKAYVVGTHLKCMDLSMQFKWVPTTYAFIKKILN